MSTRPARGGLLHGLARACHPEPTVAVTAVAAGLAVSTGRDAPGVLAVLAAVLAGQLSIGWCNDYLDRERDRATARTDKPVVAGSVPAEAVGLAAVLALLACVPLSLLSGLVAGLTHLVAVGCAWAYNLALKSTVVSVLPYAVAFGLLPAYVVLGLPGHLAPPAWLVAAGALLGSGAHFANVLPDLADDLRTGIRGLPHRLGPAGSRLAAAVLLLLASILLALGPAGLPRAVGFAALGLCVCVLAGGFTLARRAGSRAAFRAVLVVAVVDVGLLLAGGRAIG